MSRWINPCSVRSPKSRCHFRADPENVRDREGFESIDSLLKGLASNIFHDQIRNRLFVHFVGAHDILAVDRGGSARFADESATRVGASYELRAEYFDGHHASQLLVERLEHDAEAALAEQLQHLEMPQPAQRPWLTAWLQERKAFVEFGTGPLYLARGQLARRRYVRILLRFGRGIVGLRDLGRLEPARARFGSTSAHCSDASWAMIFSSIAVFLNQSANHPPNR